MRDWLKRSYYKASTICIHSHYRLCLPCGCKGPQSPNRSEQHQTMMKSAVVRIELQEFAISNRAKLLTGSFRELVMCAIWQLFVADPTEQIMNQERFLFSWRLLLIDAILLTYLLFVTFIALLLGINATTNVVQCALFKYAIHFSLLLSTLVVLRGHLAYGNPNCP